MSTSNSCLKRVMPVVAATQLLFASSPSTPVSALAFPIQPNHGFRSRTSNNVDILDPPSFGRYKSSPLRSRRPLNPSLALFATETSNDEATSSKNGNPIEIGPLDGPSSVLFYDDVLDESMDDGVVCSRGVCVLVYDDDEEDDSFLESILSSYLGPRIMLAFASILYGTNFALGAIMNDALTPSAATADRLFLAAVALSPFLFQLNPAIAPLALVSGTCVSVGYITQSLALVDTSPATVAFLGAATVIVCPFLEAVVNKKPMGLKDAPQTWLAATLCIVGVGVLELYNPNGGSMVGLESVGAGDVLSLVQAVGFGSSFFVTEQMMRKDPTQALPITAVQVATAAFFTMIWSVQDGWIGTADGASYGVPFLFGEENLQMAAAAVVWTGLITTAINRLIETVALGRVSSNEASVLLATEPLWAALFAALLLHDDFGANDYIGGALIVLACLATSLKSTDFDRFFSSAADDENTKDVDAFM